MPDIPYSPRKVDLFFPARSDNFFAGIPPDTPNDPALCAEMCRLAYCRKEPAFSFDRDRIIAVLQQRGCSVQFFESQGTPDGMGTHCLLVADPARQLAIAAFRGTDAIDPTDLFDDADALQIAWPRGGNVHAGFAHALAYVQDNLLAAIHALNLPIHYTGHSLGAAMATLLASLRPPTHLYTIGSPRVGDNGFVATLAQVPASRFVDCCDLVTRVPPEQVPGLGAYQHFGPPIYIFQNRTVALDPGDDVIQQDRLRAAADYLIQYAWHTGNVAVRDLADHAAINYVEALKES